MIKLTALTAIHERVLKRFSLFLEDGSLGHAYLFVGPQDTGKMTTALAIAKLVNCVNRRANTFCDECPSCIKIAKGSHPDIHVISAGEEASIKIEKIRKINSEIQLRAFEAAKKVFIIKDIDLLTLEAANAFLKTLEEPTKNNLLILTTINLEKNLDTIKSRCQIVHFYPPSSRILKEKLLKAFPQKPEMAHFLAYFSEGCLGRAQRLAEQKVFENKNKVIDNFMYQGHNDSYFKALVSDKKKVKEALHVLLSWFRDLTLWKLSAPQEGLIHLDRLDDLRRFDADFSFNQLLEIIEDITKAMHLVEENLNIKLPMTLIKERIKRV